MPDDITELQALDFSLGAVIAEAFSDLASNGPANYKSFIERPVKEKIFRVEHEDAGGLVRKIANAAKGQNYSVEPEPLKTKPVLPVIAYYRKPGFTNGDEYATVLDKTMFDSSLLTAIKASVLPIAIDYSMTIATWDKPSLDKLQLAWYKFLVKNNRKNVRFKVPVQIAGEIFETPAIITNANSVIFSDTSPMKQEVGRIYSVSTDFTIVSFAMTGEGISVPDSINIHGITTRYIE